MACVKTAISVEESLFKEAEDVAREMNVSRSKLFSEAIRDFIQRRRTEDLTRKINEALVDYPDEEDEANLRFSAASFAMLTEDDEW